MKITRFSWLCSPLLALSSIAGAQQSVDGATSGLWAPVQKDYQAPDSPDPRPDSTQIPIPASLASATPVFDPERVYFDEPGDGRLWARGANYKARFDSEGAMYSPYLGPDAQRAYPVSLRLRSVTVGGRSIDFEPSVRPTLETDGEGGVVSFDRGGLVEHYVLRADSMEQRFRLYEVPGGGDLLVSMHADTDLQASESDLGFSFGCSLGCVNYSRAIAFDNDGRQVVAPTSLVDGRIEIRVPASFLASARYPITIDPVISTFALDTSTFADIRPDIAYDSSTTRYYVVWQRLFNGSDWDIFGQTYNSLGNLVAGSGRYIDITDEDWQGPQVAANRLASQFLVVATQGGSIVGRTRSSNSTSQSSQFLIALGGFGATLSNPDVGGDPHPVGPTYYCVSWENSRPAGDDDIHARVISTDLSYLGPILNVTSSPNRDQNPQISQSAGLMPSGNQAWTVVWESSSSIIGQPVRIRGAQITWSGFLSPDFLVSADLVNDSLNPSVSTLLDGLMGERAYLVAFERSNGGQTDIYGRVMRGSVAATNTLNLTELQGINVSGEQTEPQVESDGSSFVLVHQEPGLLTASDIYISTMNLSGNMLTPAESHLVFSAAPGSQVSPRITSTHSSGGSSGLFMGTWRTVVGLLGGDIHAGRYITPGPGDVYCTSHPNTTGLVGKLKAFGSISINIKDFQLIAFDCPPNKPGLFFLGPNQVNTPFGDGRRCVGGQTKRVVPIASTGSTGEAFRSLNFNLPYAASIFAGGSGVNYQYWFRDAAGGPGGFNLTNALHVEHTP